MEKTKTQTRTATIIRKEAIPAFDPDDDDDKMDWENQNDPDKLIVALAHQVKSNERKEVQQDKVRVLKNAISSLKDDEKKRCPHIHEYTGAKCIRRRVKKNVADKNGYSVEERRYCQEHIYSERAKRKRRENKKRLSEMNDDDNNTKPSGSCSTKTVAKKAKASHGPSASASLPSIPHSDVPKAPTLDDFLCSTAEGYDESVQRQQDFLIGDRLEKLGVNVLAAEERADKALEAEKRAAAAEAEVQKLQKQMQEMLRIQQELAQRMTAPAPPSGVTAGNLIDFTEAPSSKSSKSLLDEDPFLDGGVFMSRSPQSDSGDEAGSESSGTEELTSSLSTISV